MSQTPHTSATPASAVDRDMLQDYLNQHLLGSRPGVPAFRAAAQTWAGTEHEDDLTRLADGVEESQEHLQQLIADLGFSTPAHERAVGAAAAVGGRLNPVNTLRSQGSGWTQVELDVLAGALQGQAEMWRVLEQLAPHVPGLDVGEMRRAYEKTLGFIAQVQRVTDDTLRRRFLG